MRRTGGVLLVVVGLLASGCGAARDLPVPAGFQQAVRDVARDKEPAFTGSTCLAFKDDQETYRYRAEYTVAEPVEAVTARVRTSGLARGWQVFRAKSGAFLMSSWHERGPIIVGVSADGPNTKVSAVNSYNCANPADPGRDVPEDDPLHQAMAGAVPELGDGQKRVLERAYTAGRELSIAIAPLLDTREIEPSVALPLPVDLAKGPVEVEACSGGVKLHAKAAAVQGFISGTTDIEAVEQRVYAAARAQWQAVDRSLTDQHGLSVRLARASGSTTVQLYLTIARGEDQQKRPGLTVRGAVLTGCVPSTAS
ncbi:hypothetical protein [Kibdelosporangium phytohabitans]|uniref:Lipoprotein n=1 Tax=Kibdelosporangium phytohabitans TaxID=860235 RepID=A0A0N9I2J9_9PSEU|nr:hypothetical protein [Kibdelosporangium phytohabitans]ALG08956.1 hypothetical protein AOZ06_20390 [Kibdelosporangium phytohabitans]MBE1469872.1 hypothetical protein [Kibdelosporangium phytohabitans]